MKRDFVLWLIQLSSARARARSPKWLKYPTGASFGFGSKFVSFHSTASPQGVVASKSEVNMLPFALHIYYVHNLILNIIHPVLRCMFIVW